MKINGYLNKVELTSKFSKRFSLMKNLLNEAKVYDLLGIVYSIDGLTLKRELLPGKQIKEWDKNIEKLLLNEINKYHELPSEGFDKFPWYKYDDRLKMFETFIADKYIKIRDSLVCDVLSHNDINAKNFILDQKNNQVHLIDFEWTSINHRYFDYINVFIHEGVVLLDDVVEKEWADVMFMTLCYFIMWSEDYKENDYISRLRKKYWLLLDEML